MLCPYCKKQTPLYKKTCVNCGKEIPREMGDTLFTDGALESIESSLEQVAKTQSFAVDQVIAGKYLVKGLIGRGNFGIVYRCQDQETRKTVAIKTIYERLLPDDQTKQSLISYIEKTKDIDLPGISRVLNHGEEEGLVFVVYEYLIGQTLSNMLKLLRNKEKEMDGDQVRDTLLDLCDTLSQAHEHAVHFNLRPQNIFLTKKGTRIADFGIAGGLVFSISKTHLATIDGVEYRAPEVTMQSSDAGPAADIYSIGALAHVIINGIPPKETPGDAASIAGQFPEQVGQVILNCLVQNPQERYDSATRLKDEFDKAFAGTPIEALAEAPPAEEVARKEAEIDVFAHPEEPQVSEDAPAAAEPMGAVEVGDLMEGEPAAAAAPHEVQAEEQFVEVGENGPIMGADVIREVFDQAVSETPIPEESESGAEAEKDISIDDSFKAGLDALDIEKTSDRIPGLEYAEDQAEAETEEPAAEPTTEAEGETDIVSQFLSEFDTPGPTVIPKADRAIDDKPESMIKDAFAEAVDKLDMMVKEPVAEAPAVAPTPPVAKKPKVAVKPAEAQKSIMPVLIVTAVILVSVALAAFLYRGELANLFGGAEPAPTPAPTTPVPTPAIETTPAITPEVVATPEETPEDAAADLDDLLASADENYQRGAYIAASRDYRKVLDIDSGNQTAQSRLRSMERNRIRQGDRYYNQENWDRAIAYYREALSINAGSRDARNKLNRALEKKAAAVPTPPENAAPDTTPPATPDDMVDLENVTTTPTPETVDLDTVPVTPPPSATPTPEPSDNQQGLTRDQINSTISRYLGRIKVCYRTGLENNPNLSGVVWVRFSVGADGSVVNATITQSTLNDPAVEACVLRRVQRMKFPQPGGGSATVNYKFTFQE